MKKVGIFNSFFYYFTDFFFAKNRDGIIFFIELPYFSNLKKKTYKSLSTQYLVFNNVGFMLEIHIFDSKIIFGFLNIKNYN